MTGFNVGHAVKKQHWSVILDGHPPVSAGTSGSLSLCQTMRDGALVELGRPIAGRQLSPPVWPAESEGPHQPISQE